MSIVHFPNIPTLETQAQGRQNSSLRYEDVVQDGRLVLSVLPFLSSELIWRTLFANVDAVHESVQAGILPVLTRLVLEATEVPASVNNPIEATGGYFFAHDRDETEAISRIFFNEYVELFGETAKTYGPQPSDVGTRKQVGRVFAERVFTRPFAPPNERKVTSLTVRGTSVVPPVHYPFRSVQELFSRVLSEDNELAPWAFDETPAVFAMLHTDSNQHVNSLVYIRMFEESALRYLWALGRPLKLLARSCEIAFRKPCFAGETLKWVRRVTRVLGQIIVIGALVEPHTSLEDVQKSRFQPRCVVRMSFA